MIPIRDDVPRREHRPPLDVPVFKRLAIRLAAPLFQRLNAARHQAAERELMRILTAARECRTRPDLEALLGRPAYALDPTGFSIGEANGRSRRPDHVEVYLSRGCTIDVLFFLDEATIELVGFCSPNAVDAVLGFPTKSTD
jgi:hypothetical protein